MKLLTIDAQRRLLQNGEIRRDITERGEAAVDFYPVVKLYTPDAAATWLLTDVDPDYPQTAFGLCDLGLGFPELGSVYLCELENVRGPMGMPVECDPEFAAMFTISVYARAAREAGRITERREDLERTCIALHKAEQAAQGGTS